MARARDIVAGKAVEDGVLLVCSCGHETHVVTVKYDQQGQPIPTAMKQAFTCDGCGTHHWITIQWLTAGDNVDADTVEEVGDIANVHYREVRKVLNAFRSLPVEQRMEAMGMRAVNLHGGQRIVWVED